jgi:hypothetical protein
LEKGNEEPKTANTSGNDSVGDAEIESWREQRRIASVRAARRQRRAAVFTPRVKAILIGSLLLVTAGGIWSAKFVESNTRGDWQRALVECPADGWWHTNVGFLDSDPRTLILTYSGDLSNLEESKFFNCVGNKISMDRPASAIGSVVWEQFNAIDSPTQFEVSYGNLEVSVQLTGRGNRECKFYISEQQ